MVYAKLRIVSYRMNCTIDDCKTKEEKEEEEEEEKEEKKKSKKSELT